MAITLVTEDLSVNEGRTAINSSLTDLDTRLSVVETSGGGNLSTLTTQVNTNTSDIATLQSAVSGLPALETSVNTNIADIATLQTDVSTIQTDVLTLQTDFANITPASIGADPAGAASTAISDHVAAADPHTQYQLRSEKDTPNGYAGLNSSGILDGSVIPSYLGQGISYFGSWDAATNTPTLSDSSVPSSGTYYKVSSPGVTLLGGFSSWAVGDWVISNGVNWDKISQTTVGTASAVGNSLQAFTLVVSDETTPLVTGTSVYTWRAPYAFQLNSIRASLTTAPTGADVIVDVKRNGTTLFSTPLHVDAGTTTSVGSATTPVINNYVLSDNDEITVDITQVGSTNAGTGLKVYLRGAEYNPYSITNAMLLML